MSILFKIQLKTHCEFVLFISSTMRSAGNITAEFGEMDLQQFIAIDPQIKLEGKW